MNLRRSPIDGIIFAIGFALGAIFVGLVCAKVHCAIRDTALEATAAAEFWHDEAKRLCEPKTMLAQAQEAAIQCARIPASKDSILEAERTANR